MKELNLSSLPSLYEQSVKLIDYLVIVSPDNLNIFLLSQKLVTK